jgi:serine/threonine protein kinase
MGVVYLAEHQMLKRQVAIKVLLQQNTEDKLALDRFYREARAVAALDHPNIVKAYDVGEFAGTHCLVMEYVQGANLHNHLVNKGAIFWRSAVRLIGQACKGLQHAHERGLVHRDIKPGNLLVDRQGTLKILDLGMARCFRNDTDALTKQLSDSNEVTGSVDYMAPEIGLGSPDVDIRADIYSLGVTLYALIAGKPPFEGTIPQKILQHQIKPLPPLAERAKDAPAELCQVIVRMTQKEPTDRYATPDDVLNALSPWLGGDTMPVPVRTPESRVTPGPRPMARPPAPSPAVMPTGHEETKPIRAEDTQVSSASSRDPESSHRRRRKRFKKKRSSWSGKPILIGASIMIGACTLVGLTIWGVYALVTKSGDKSTQVASNTNTAGRAPNSPARPPVQGSGSVVGPGSPNSPPPQPPSGPPPESGEGLQVGQQAPEIEGEDLGGTEFLLSDYRGKVVLLSFWGFW